MTDLSKIPTKKLLIELYDRGGHPGALAQAALLCLQKSEDYNSDQIQNPHLIDRSAYFPFGVVSYAQMLHTKAQRFISLTNKVVKKQTVNFEGLEDTAMDIINYAGFFVSYHKQDLAQKARQVAMEEHRKNHSPKRSPDVDE